MLLITLDLWHPHPILIDHVDPHLLPIVIPTDGEAEKGTGTGVEKEIAAEKEEIAAEKGVKIETAAKEEKEIEAGTRSVTAAEAEIKVEVRKRNAVATETEKGNQLTEARNR